MATTTQTRNQTQAPFLTPTTPPPGSRRPVTIPAAGTWVRVVCADGGLSGKVVASAPGRLRLKDGAGWWDIDAATIVGISEISAPVVDQAALRRRAERERTYQVHQVQRILDRWP